MHGPGTGVRLLSPGSGPSDRSLWSAWIVERRKREKELERKGEGREEKKEERMERQMMESKERDRERDYEC